MPNYKCAEKGCGKSFDKKSNFTRHRKIHEPRLYYFCPICHLRIISRKDNLIDHIQKQHNMTREMARSKTSTVVPLTEHNENRPPPANDTTCQEHASRKRKFDHGTGSDFPAKKMANIPEKVTTTENSPENEPETISDEHSPPAEPEVLSDEHSPPAEPEVISDEHSPPKETPKVRKRSLKTENLPRFAYKRRRLNRKRSPSHSHDEKCCCHQDEKPKSTRDKRRTRSECPIREPHVCEDKKRARSESPGSSHRARKRREEEEEAPRSPPAGEELPEFGPRNWLPTDQYEMKYYKPVHSRLLKTTAADYEVKVKPFESNDLAVIYDRLEAVIDSALDKSRETAVPNAKGKIAISFPGLDPHINIRFDDIWKITGKDLMDTVAKVVNSNQKVSLDDFALHVAFTEMPSGGRGERFEDRYEIEKADWVRKKKQSLLNVSAGAGDDDMMCLARCLVVGRFMADHPDDFRTTIAGTFKTIVDGRRADQRNKAINLHTFADVSTEEESGMDELDKFQKYLKDYQIVVYESVASVTDVIYPTTTPIEPHNKRIYLWLHDRHFCLIEPNYVAGFLGRDHFCHACMQAWNNGPSHKCDKAICKLCANPKCENTSIRPNDGGLHCNDCNRDFKSVKCRTAHKAKECKNLVFCDRCLKLVSRKKRHPTDHNCLLNYCRFCAQYQEPGHRCFVQRPKKKKEERNENGGEESNENGGEEGIDYLLGEYEYENGYEDDNLDAEGNPAKKKKKTKKPWFCDIESELNDLQHDPIMMCLKNESGEIKHFYEGPESECLDKFFVDLYKKKEFSDSNFIFHNFAGYDGLHILKIFYKNCLDPHTLFRGSKALTMSIPKLNVTFTDSYLHIPSALAQLPKQFGITEIKKGYFPYKLCTKENRGYLGAFPEEKYFDPKGMTPEKYKDFKAWYVSELSKYQADPDKKYCLRDEMLAYCFNDCEVDRQAFNKYRETMKKLYNNLDPADYITLPSYINHAYRAHSMPEDSLGIIPSRGYDQKGKTSPFALAWLLWEAKQRNIPIQHGRNGAEVKFGKYYLDGYYVTPEGDKMAWEYNGCRYHGCPHCILWGRDRMFLGKSFEQRHQETEAKAKFLKDSGIELISMYGCQFRDLKYNDYEMEEFVDETVARLKKFDPLSPRDALRGGRTNAIYLYYKAKLGEILGYHDFTSLYPAINVCTEPWMWYPVGHPDIYLCDFPDLKDSFGLIKARIQPPKQLFMPVLPVMANGKVIYGLCSTCIDRGNTSSKCEHSEAERAIEGTFDTMTVLKAVELGYKVEEIYVLWNWPEERRSQTLFRDFLLPAYATKVEASGWPNDVKTEEEKREYVAEYERKQGIIINPDNVKANDPEKQCSKLRINNFWGYLTKDESSQTKVCTKYHEFVKLVRDETKVIMDYHMPNENMLVVTYKSAPGCERPDGKTSCIHGIFTTAMARLKLQTELEKLGDRVLYFDTDSVVWIKRPGETELKPGNLLGDLTDEIKVKYGKKYGDNAYISEFCAGGPKTYSLFINDKRTGEQIDTIIRCKGISLTTESTKTVSAESMRKMVMENLTYKVPQHIMRRDKKEGNVRSVNLEKSLRVTFSKRIWPDGGGPSLPIGWQEI